MGRLLISWFINAVALAVAAWALGDNIFIYKPQWLNLIAAAFLFGLVNALIRPIVKLLTCPLVILTLGLFTLVINGLMLSLASWIGQQFGVGFYVDGFWTAFFGAIIISVVSFVLSLIFGDRGDGRRKREEHRRDRW